MNAKWKLKWIKALRSGKYRKGREHLKHRGRYCCLGVLTDIVCKENPKINREDVLDDVILRSSIIKICKLKSRNPEVTYKGETLTLATLNDGSDIYAIKPLSFKKIADLIEEQL